MKSLRFTWTYDKLKPYGLAISGCIDSYSWKVLWWFAKQLTATQKSLNTTFSVLQSLESYQCDFAQTTALKMGQWQQCIVPYDHLIRIFLQELPVICMDLQQQTKEMKAGVRTSENSSRF